LVFGLLLPFVLSFSFVPTTTTTTTTTSATATTATTTTTTAAAAAGGLGGLFVEIRQGREEKDSFPRLVHKSFPWHTFCHCHYCCYYYYYFYFYCYYCCCISQSKETRNKFICDWNLLSFLLLLLRFLPRLLPLASIVNLLLLLPQRVLTPAGVQTAWFCDFSVGTTAILGSCSGITLPLSRIGFFSSIGSEASLWWKGSLAQVLDSLGGKNMVGTFFTFHYSLILSLWLPLWLLVSSSVAGTNWCHFKD